MKSKEFIKRLKRAGVEIIEGGKGSHVKVAFKNRKTTVPVHGNTDIRNNLLKEICKQLGLDHEEIF
jgi:predicted RNA binding protein YcfA (HicA-like mRNA interferase family)